MGRKEEARKDNARLRKMDFQIRFLYTKIYNFEAVRFGKIKNQMENQSDCRVENYIKQIENYIKQIEICVENQRKRGKNLMECWKEKVSMKNKVLYNREKEKFFNRNGWSIEEIENMWKKDLKMEIENMIVEREKDIQRQTVDRITNTRYNKRYKELGVEIERNIVIILEEKQILREWVIG